MSKFVLIHGFAVHLTSPIVRSPLGPSASFKIFEKQVKSGEAAVFSWGVKKQVPFFRLLDPFFLLDFYQTEKNLAVAPETLGRLRDFLEQEKPEVIVCHSMGCFLLNNFCKKFPLPNSVKKIIFIQSDDFSTSSFSTPTLRRSLAKEGPSPSILNLFCPWDPTLLISAIINQALPTGLVKNPKADKNILWPLFLPINLHTSTLRDERFLRFFEAF